MVTSVAIREFLHSLVDTAATGSQKVYTVPAGEVWEVLSVNVNLQPPLAIDGWSVSPDLPLLSRWHGDRLR